MTSAAALALRGELRFNEPLSLHTSFRVGGPASQFYQPADLEDLSLFLRKLPAETTPIWLGLGSNVLVRDGGIAGVVVATQGCLRQLTSLDTVTVRAEAGVACAQLARFCARHALQGAEFWAGIPGTVGGALAMNAGCAGGETWDSVIAVETMDRAGQVRLRTPQDFTVHYRHVERPVGEWFVAGHFRLQKGEKEAALEKIRELLERRAATQPTGEPNCGSVFRNPPQDYAARLIESCGLKGFAMGGACVSEKHANFIINTGRALAADIEALITHVANTVLEKYGVSLIKEVHILGEAGSSLGN